MVWSSQKDARILTSVTGAKMSSTGQEVEAWRNLTQLDRCCQSVQNRTLGRICPTLTFSRVVKPLLSDMLFRGCMLYVSLYVVCQLSHVFPWLDCVKIGVLQSGSEWVCTSLSNLHTQNQTFQ